jgi:RHS repeat-associated protein
MAASNVGEQGVSLPTGGGAVRGISDSFSPDLFTGTANLRLPLDLPPGRNNLTPALALHYSSGYGNGAFGLGWALELPGVSRKTSAGIPRYDAGDVFVLSGSEDLVAVPGGDPSATRYRPRVESAFARIEHVRDARHNYWIVRSRDGLVSLYGTPRPSDAAAGWRDPAVVADPADLTRIFEWRLSRTVDPCGNAIEYRHTRDGAQVYLQQIRYVDYGDPVDPSFLVAATFGYDDRPDPFSNHRTGFELRTARRCRRIDVTTHAGTETAARSYRFDYESARNGVSLLKTVRTVGHDGTAEHELPPLELGYTAFEPDRRLLRPLTAEVGYLPERSLAHPDYELVDVFSNALPCVLHMNGTSRCWRNLGSGRLAFPRSFTDAPAGVALGGRGVQIADFDGDGRPDLLVTDGTRGGHYPLAGDGGWDRAAFVAHRRAPPIDLDHPDVALVDLDGDGVIDALRTGVDIELYYNAPGEGWRDAERRPGLGAKGLPRLTLADARVRLADMTGDQLQDIVLIHSGRIDYWPYQGHGRWGAMVTMRDAPHFDDRGTYGTTGYDARRLLLGDVDGDGCADLIYVGNNHVTVWLNRCGNGWSEPTVITGTPAVSDAAAVRLADMDGTGTPGVLWTYDHGDVHGANYLFLDLTGGRKPYLLDRVYNSMGATTRLRYASSTAFYLRDESRPETRWRTRLPFPVQVVQRVETDDALSGGSLVTEYAYHHGHWDGAEREFRGFGRVDQRDTEVLAGGAADPISPPTETRTWFHLGPVGPEVGDWTELDLSHEYWDGDATLLPRPADVAAFLISLPRRVRRDAIRALRGRTLRSELYALDDGPRQGRPYTVTEHQHAVAPLPVGRAWPSGAANGDWRHRVFFAHARAERTTQWDRGNDPMTRISTFGDHDAYGQPRAEVSIAVPRGRDPARTGPPGEPYLVKLLRTHYASRDDAQRYIVDRVATVTTFEITNDGGLALPGLLAGIDGGTLPTVPIGQLLNYYDGAAFQGLPIGQLGDRGAAVRSERLVLTRGVLAAAWAAGAGQGASPPYLTEAAAPTWTAEYPAEFRALAPERGGYVFRSAAPHVTGYFAVTERRRYDFHDDPTGRGLPTATRDALNRETRTGYDAYGLLPIAVTNAAGLTTNVDYDYRVLQPRQITDANGNRAAVAFTPLGLLASRSVHGGPGEGDTSRPSVVLSYDLDAFRARGEPVSVRTTRYVHHDSAAGVPASERDAALVSVEYSDGFGRVLQTRTLAEPIAFGDARFGNFGGPANDYGLPLDHSRPTGDAVGRAGAAGAADRVVVSGWQTYDNKGRVIEKYEPFFDDGFTYRSRLAAPPEVFGAKITMRYDARGQLVRMVHPDGSEHRVVLGVPGTRAAPALSNPDVFEPTPWETYEYDGNDNAGRTNPVGAAAYSLHWNTPTSREVDALGRIRMVVHRNGPDLVNDAFTTTSTYDLRGNLTGVTDALGRRAYAAVHDLLDRVWRVARPDAGAYRAALDASGATLEERDAKGALVLRATDVIGRPIRQWARDAANRPITLRDRTVYGDGADSGLTRVQAAAVNALGREVQAYDGAGLRSLSRYDFKGNVLEQSRRVIRLNRLAGVYAAASASQWNGVAFRTDWQPPAGTTLAAYAATLLDPAAHEISSTFDALNRTVTTRLPQNAAGATARSQIRIVYGRSGLPERIEADGSAYVERIAYNARGQRTLIAYGCGRFTRYAYHQWSLRLARLRTERFTTPAPLTYRGTAPPLQDLAYTHDESGNLLATRERAPGVGVPGHPDALDRVFGYDPLYRLVSASGRECAASAAQWHTGPRCVDVNATRDYTETYEYDRVGNLTRLSHGHSAGRVVREFPLIAGSNRPSAVTGPSGAGTYALAFDAAGNLSAEATSRHYEWDHRNRLATFRVQVAGGEPSEHVQYLYGIDGQRTVKLVRKQGGRLELTVYVGPGFELHSSPGGTTPVRNSIVHVLDGSQRVAEVRSGPPLARDRTPAVMYHLADHLGGSCVTVDGGGAPVNREEYLPWGETSFGSFARKRYRYGGKERDEASGLYDHGARQYSPLLGRWTSCDPDRLADGPNPYVAFKNNPLRYVDPAGRTSTTAAQCGGVTVTGVEVPVEQADAGTYVRDEIAGYRLRARAPTSSTPDPRDAGTATSSTPVRTVPERRDASTSTGPPDAGPPPVRYSVGIGINVSDTTKFGDVNAGRNVGHTVVYTRDPQGKTEVLSFGPSRSVERNSYEFLNGSLPATPTYGLEKKDNYNLYEWSVSKAQFDSATTVMTTIRADAGVYSLDRQCTSVSIETARAAGITVPDGLGEISHPWIPYNPTVSTPYHLDQELQDKSRLVPTTVGAEHFKNQLKIK